jgi:hypothetical protein
MFRSKKIIGVESETHFYNFVMTNSHEKNNLANGSTNRLPNSSNVDLELIINY